MAHSLRKKHLQPQNVYITGHLPLPYSARAEIYACGFWNNTTPIKTQLVLILSPWWAEATGFQTTCLFLLEHHIKDFKKAPLHPIIPLKVPGAPARRGTRSKSSDPRDYSLTSGFAL